ncbi:MAG: hypothetical protein A2X18_06475 [Bacteroidetes bacterium GWF2_40_14]|nr:MAG: hypothetical protein A2X18_06475 [Bacteroidetes bacterium GWF2_40_14]
MSNRDIIQYDGNGKYLGRFSIPQGDNFTVYPAIYLNDSTYAAIIDAYDKSIPEYSVLIFNPSDSIKYLMPITQQNQKYLIDIQQSDKDKLPPSMKDMVFVGMGTNIYRYKDSARVVFSYNDTIFSLSPDLKLQSAYIIHFGKTNKEKQASLLRTPKESEGYLYLLFELKVFAHEPYEKVYTLKNGTVKSISQTDCYALFNKKTGYFTLLNQPEMSMPGINEDILSGPPFWPSSISSKGELITIYTVEELLKWKGTHKVSPKLAKIIESLGDLDNPVVVIAR